MQRKRWMAQVAKMTALLYLVFVVANDMLAAGFGNVQVVEQSARGASTGTAITIANTTKGEFSFEGTVKAQIDAVVSDTNQIKITCNATSATNSISEKIGIYTVKVYNNESAAAADTNGTEYYCSSDESGLYYSEDDGAWLLNVSSLTDSTTLKVQVTYNFYVSEAVSVTDTSKSTSFSAGETYASSSMGDKVKTALKDIEIQYYNYDLKAVSETYDKIGNYLQFYCASTNTDEGRYIFEIKYGKSYFTYAFGSSDNNNNMMVLSLWYKDTTTQIAYREPGTNRVVINPTYTGTKKVLVLRYAGGSSKEADGQKLITASNFDDADAAYLSYPDTSAYTGIYLRNNATYSPKYSMQFAVNTNGSYTIDDKENDYYWSGCSNKSSISINLKVGESTNIANHIVNNGTENSTDYIGDVSAVGSITEAAGTFSNDYFKIDEKGNITALGVGTGSYSVTLKYTYTQFATVKVDDASSIYYTGKTKEFTDSINATDTVTVTMKFTITGNTTSTTEATTTAAATTTEKATTAATTTTATQAATTQTPTTTVTSHKITLVSDPTGAPASTLSRTTAEQGTTITVTTGAPTADYKNPVVTCKTTSGTLVTVSNNSFTMPDEDVTVTVTYKTLTAVSATTQGTGWSANTYTATTSTAPTAATLSNLFSSMTLTYGTDTTTSNVAESNIKLGTETTSDSTSNGITTTTHTCPFWVVATNASGTVITSTQYTYVYKTEQDNRKTVTLTQSSADKTAVMYIVTGTTETELTSGSKVASGTTIKVKAPASATYAYADIIVTGGTVQKTVAYDTDGTATMTFTVTDDATVKVTYNTLTIKVAKTPTKTDYGTARPESIDLTGMQLTPSYGSHTLSNITDMSDVTAVLQSTSTSVTSNGITTYTVPVDITYNGQTITSAFKITYKKYDYYDITASAVSSVDQTTTINANVEVTPQNTYYGDTVTVTAPLYSDNKDAILTGVIYSAGSNSATYNATKSDELSDSDNLVYTFAMPAGTTTVKALYQPLTKISVTVPTEEQLSAEVWSVNTALKDLPAGSYKLVYGTAYTSDAISLQPDSMYECISRSKNDGIKNDDGSTTVTHTVTVGVNILSYGAVSTEPGTPTFEYSYTETIAANAKEISVDVQPSEMNGNVTAVPSAAVKGDTITVTASASQKYAYATITATSGTGETTSIDVANQESDSDGKRVATFTMPDDVVSVSVVYESVSDVTITTQPAGAKQYSSYQPSSAISMDKGVLTVTYGNNAEHTRMVAMTDSAIQYTCSKDDSTVDSTGTDGTVYKVPVTVVYAGLSAYATTFDYTYIGGFHVSVNTNASDIESSIKLSQSTDVETGTEVTMSLPELTTTAYEKYMLPIVTIGDKEIEKNDRGTYSFTVTGNTEVSVQYSELSEIQIIVPKTREYSGAVDKDTINIDGLSATAVYSGTDVTRPISVTSENISIIGTPTTKLSDDGTQTTYTQPVQVTVTYGGKTAQETFYYTYVETKSEEPDDKDTSGEASGDSQKGTSADASGNPQEGTSADASGNPQEGTSGDASGNPQKGTSADVSGNPQKGTSGDASGNAKTDASGNASGNASADAQKKTTTKTTAKTKTPKQVTVKKVTMKNRKMKVTWAKATNATYYEVYVSDKKNKGYQRVAIVKGTSYTVDHYDGHKLRRGRTYYVKVRGVYGAQKCKTQTQTKQIKCKRNGRLEVSFKAVKNAVSYTVTVSKDKKKNYKKGFQIKDTGLKKYSERIKRCGSSKVRKNRKYYVKIATSVDTAKHTYGAYSKVQSIKCK